MTRFATFGLAALLARLDNPPLNDRQFLVWHFDA